MDNRTDAEKETSPYFDHWEYTGNAAQKFLKTGPKKAIFKTITETEARILAEAGDEIYLEPRDYEKVLVEFADDPKKAITYQRFLVLQEEYGVNLEKLYKKSPWVYKCVDVRAMALATMPWVIMKGETEQKNTDIARLLREVNPEANWKDLIASTEKDLCIYGLAYWWKVRGGGDPATNTSGTIRFIKRLNPASMEIKASKDGISHFEQSIESGTPRKFARENIILFRNYDPVNDFGTISPLETCKTAVKIEIEANKCLTAFFENKAMPDVVMTSKEVIPNTELKKLMLQWKREFGGSEKQHKTGFISHGFEPKEMGYAPSQLALSEIRQEIRRDITCAFGVPIALISGAEAVNYGTLKTHRRSLYTETIIPRSEYIQGVINAELMNEFKGGLEFRFLPEKLDVMQEDKDRSAESVARLVEAGVIKPEVGAVAVGFKVDDAGIGKQAVPSFPPKEMPTKTIDNNDDYTNELRLWRKKSIKRVKAGRPAACEFKSEFIPSLTIASIGGQLENAEGEDDVDMIFDEAELWIDFP